MPSTTTKKGARESPRPAGLWRRGERCRSGPAAAPARGAQRHARRQLPQAAAGLGQRAGRRPRERLQRDRRAAAAPDQRAGPRPAGRRPRGPALRAAAGRRRRGRLGEVDRVGQRPGLRPGASHGRAGPGRRRRLGGRPDPAHGRGPERPAAARRAAPAGPQRERAREPALRHLARDHPGDPRGRHRGQARWPGPGPQRGRQLARPDRRGQRDVVPADRAGARHRPRDDGGRRTATCPRPSRSRSPARWPSSRSPSTGWSTSSPRSRPR